MASFAAAMLDELMGRNRNCDPKDKKEDLNFTDPQVCRYHLCGFCPHDLFTNTRADLGSCYKIHDDELARIYRRSDRRLKLGYESEYLSYLESLANEVDKKIKRGQARLALNAQNQEKIEESQLTDAQEARLKELTEKINVLIEKAEKLGCEGEVDEAQLVMIECDLLKDERRKLEDMKTRPFFHNQAMINSLNNQSYFPNPANPAVPGMINGTKEMEVCKICGAFLVVGDAIQRIEEHLQGKQHLGYAKIREKIEELKNDLKGIDNEREERLRRERDERERLKHQEREKSIDKHRGNENKTKSRSRKSHSEKRSRSRSRSHDKRREKRRNDEDYFDNDNNKRKYYNYHHDDNHRSRHHHHHRNPGYRDY